jgi:hypothetical protein
MKKLLLATTLFAAFGSAQALPVSDVLLYDTNQGPSSGYDTGVSFNFKGVDLNKAITGISTGPFSNMNYSGNTGGSLFVDVAPADLTFTYLGREAGHINSFTYDFAGANENGFFTTAPQGTNFQVSVSDQGYLELQFKDVTTPLTAFSGYAGTNSNNARIGFLDVSEMDFGALGQFDYLILFNDNYSDTDYNDMVVGVKAVQAIPEPETYALMLAGLGVVGFMARRRRQV